MPSRPPKTVTLILGGARSGKSRYAQELASALARVHFLSSPGLAATFVENVQRATQKKFAKAAD
jgi:adenosyl cobinamide kinase/adenosyl cobinamide phosphate guanylyltransferase